MKMLVPYLKPLLFSLAICAAFWFVFRRQSLIGRNITALMVALFSFSYAPLPDLGSFLGPLLWVAIVLAAANILCLLPITACAWQAAGYSIMTGIVSMFVLSGSNLEDTGGIEPIRMALPCCLAAAVLLYLWQLVRSNGSTGNRFIRTVDCIIAAAICGATGAFVLCFTLGVESILLLILFFAVFAIVSVMAGVRLLGTRRIVRNIPDPSLVEEMMYDPDDEKEEKLQKILDRIEDDYQADLDYQYMKWEEQKEQQRRDDDARYYESLRDNDY